MPTLYDTSDLDGLIQKRIEPTIYAFKTDKVKDSIKVGDTVRPVIERVNEWGRVYSDLKLIFTKSAKAGENLYFRDYAVHQFLKLKPHIKNLKPEDFHAGVYPSKEFFKNATKKDLTDAISDIKEDAVNKTNIYSFYDSNRLKSLIESQRNQTLKLRGNQEEVVNRFKNAVDAERKNLLLYAVMRFGKTFTTLYCAQEKNYKKILVLTGKADALVGWKECVQKNTNFENFRYIDKTSLKVQPNIISETLRAGKTVITGLTLQDVNGDKIKTEHEPVFSTDWDMLIVDETHFAADADQYGKVIKERTILNNKSNQTQEHLTNKKNLKVGVTLHLSGTPYRLLLDGKFDSEDIIAQVQYSDIIAAHDKWVEENRLNENVEDWDNPYFGFPRMLRFAFDLNEKSLAIIRGLESEGYSSSLDEIFKPQSIKKDEKQNNHLKFCHEDAVLDFLKAIDGSKSDPNMLSFLDYKKIKEDNLCRHIVMVLPYKSSCDAMEKMLRSHRFNHLSNYEIINRAGHESPKIFSSSDKVGNYISKCEKENKKTITLTVNKMLTGVTVKEWDTMLFLKDTESPQEYDQAIFRLQNPFVKRYYNKKEKKEIQIVAKPQTFLLDFSPMRLFSLQERRSKIVNWSKGNGSNRQLESTISRDLKNSPIIILSANKVRPVIANEIIDKIAAYEKSKSIRDEVKLIPVDKRLLESPDLVNVIKNLNGVNNKSGILQKTYTREPGNNETEPDVNTSGIVTSTPSSKNIKDQKNKKTEEETLAEKVQAYYSLILFYALLTHDTVRGIEDIITSVEANDRNKELSKNLGISKDELSLFKGLSSLATLDILDVKILRVNQILNNLPPDDENEFLEKINFALKRFGRISDSEIVTPAHIVDEIVTTIYENNNINKDCKFLDIASKQGEFAIGLIKKYGKQIKDRVYSIPTSPIAYEFTRRIYELYDMPIDNIFKDFNSYDLIKKDDQGNINKLSDMEFDVILGNPPYQENLEVGRSLAKQLFPSFIENGIKLAPKVLALITPTRWFTADGQDHSFPKLRDFVRANNHFTTIVTHNGKKLFPDTDLGMVNYFLWEKDYSGNVKFVEIINHISTSLIRPLFEDDLDIIIPLNNIKSIIKKIKTKDFTSIKTITTGRDAFGIVGKNFEKRSKTQPFNGSIAVQGAYEEIRYIPRADVKKGLDYLDSYNVFTSKGNGGAGLLTDGKAVAITGKSYVSTPGTACTDSLIPFGKFSTLAEAENLQKYMSTKFFRFCVGILKVSQNLYQNVYAFVPMQNFKENIDIDWSVRVEDIDAQLYKKYNLLDDEVRFIDSMIKPMQLNSCFNG